MITILEGVSGLGKTTVSDMSFDFEKYINISNLYKKKHSNNFIQSLYELNLNIDFFYFIQTLEKNKNYLIDRCPLSQIIYIILFLYQGETKNPILFAEETNQKVFTEKFCEELKKTCSKWFDYLKYISKTEINLKILLSEDTHFTCNTIKKRNTFENDSFNLLNYLENQNFLFKKLNEITQLGELVYISKYYEK